MMDEPYTAALSVTGNTGAVRWSVLSGALPPGVTLASDTGALTGTPIAPGVFNVSVQAADTTSTVSRSMVLHVSGNGTYYHKYTKSGTYNVRVTTTDAAGNTATAIQTITVK
jgi:Putative Ig domain